MCEFLIFNTQKRYEKQKNFGNFSATFWQLLDTFIGNFFGIHGQLVAKPIDRNLLPANADVSKPENIIELRGMIDRADERKQRKSERASEKRREQRRKRNSTSSSYLPSPQAAIFAHFVSIRFPYFLEPRTS